MPLPARAKPPAKASKPKAKARATKPKLPPQGPPSGPPPGGSDMLAAPQGMEMPGNTPRMPSPRMVPSASAFSVNAPPLARPSAPLGVGHTPRSGVGAGQGPPPAGPMPASAQPPGMPPGWQGPPRPRPPLGPPGGPQVGQTLGSALQPRPGIQRKPPAAQPPPQGMGNDKPKKGVGAGRDLSMSARKKLPSSSFALPGKGEGPSGKGSGSYPIPDRGHAQSALSRVAQHGTPAEKATVRAKVKSKFGMGNQGSKKK